MRLSSVVLVVLGFLTICGSGYPLQPKFPSCRSPVCQPIPRNAYGCRSGRCKRVCPNSICLRKGMQKVGGSGAFAKQGCYGRKFCPPTTTPHRTPRRNHALFGGMPDKSKANKKAIMQFLADVHPMNLQRLIISTPNIDEAIRGLDSEVIRMIVKKAPNPDVLMSHLKPQTRQFITTQLRGK
eukprot:TsM_001232300 transcript=TsM_001232300 gene=TsM_001232300